jgi:hypothetical protein
MADSIPRSYLKELTDTLAAESLNLAFFVNLKEYNELTATTYTILATTATEVSESETGYTTGGYNLTTTSRNLTTNGCVVTASLGRLTDKSCTFRYLVIYNNTTKKIRFVKDLLGDRTVTNSSIRITWSETNGMIKLAFNG